MQTNQFISPCIARASHKWLYTGSYELYGHSWHRRQFDLLQEVTRAWQIVFLNKIFPGNTIRCLISQYKKSPSHRGSHRILGSISVQDLTCSVLQQLLLPQPPVLWLSSPEHMEGGRGSSAFSVFSIHHLPPSTEEM